MAEAASSQDPRKALPKAQALLLAQQQLVTGEFKQRHLDALESDVESVALYAGLINCTRILQQAQKQLQGAAPTPAQMRTMQTRNLLCVSHAACPDEAKEWIRCVRRAIQQRKNDPDAERPVNCSTHRRALERCTERAASSLLFAAALPKQPRGGLSGKDPMADATLAAREEEALGAAA
jgi:hypothetical protein